jgi:hypothetical protein
MAETVTIEGQSYLKRSPIVVLVLSLVTLGIYFFYWYYQVNDELKRYERDDTISPMRSLMAVLFGWLIIVPPFIAIYNTAAHIQRAEQRAGVQQQIEPVLVLVFQIVFSLANPPYMQDHMNRIPAPPALCHHLPPERSARLRGRRIEHMLARHHHRPRGAPRGRRVAERRRERDR